MNPSSAGAVLITGPTGGLGRATALAMADRSAGERPDLLLVGRAGPALTEVATQVRSAGAGVFEIGCDLARLADVRAAGKRVKELVGSGAVPPLRGLVANAGVTVADTRKASADGFELTFAVNYLAHAQLIGDLLGSLATPARVVLLGSNTYHQNIFRKILSVAPADWRDPTELARPDAADVSPSIKRSGTAYSNSKLAILYFAHALQRHAPTGVNVAVFEPGFMPGTGLGRDHGPAVQQVGRIIERLPGVSTPKRSGAALASIVLDDRWARLRDGAFVIKNKERDVLPIAHDRDREARLWNATAELLRTVS